MIALCCGISYILAVSSSDQSTFNQQHQKDLPSRPKRAIIFRPLFVYRNQNEPKISDRKEQLQPLYNPSYQLQKPSTSLASNSYDYSAQSAYYSPYDGNYYFPYYSQANYPAQTAVRPAVPQYYYPTTARPKPSTTKKFRPYPFWG